MTAFTEGYRALAVNAGRWTPSVMGQIEIAGSDAHALVNRIVTADLSLLNPGQCTESLLLRDDASILDRVMVYRFPERMMLVLDAAQRSAAWDHILARKRGNVRIRDISEDMAAVMVRGPATMERLSSILANPAIPPGCIATTTLGPIDVFAARMLEHGPEGLDLYCRARDRDAIAILLDSLGVVDASPSDWWLHQLEWGVATVGNEIDSGDTPMEAALDDLVAEGKGAPFPGETALAARRFSGAFKRLVGFHVKGDDVPPLASRVSVAGVMIDRVRSVANSPRVGVIGVTAVPTTAATPGNTITLASGERSWPARIMARPFVSRNVG